MDLDLKNKTVLITGASKNLGQEIALNFANEGSKLILISRERSNFNNILKKTNFKNKPHIINCDLLQENQPTIIANKILSQFKKIDIIIHNIGGGLGVIDYSSPIEDWIKVWMFNVGISIQINNVIIPAMIKNKWGRIVNISSISSRNGGTTKKTYGVAPPYAAAKAYLNMYSKILAREVARYNIIVSAVLPGPLFSKGKFWDKLNKEDPKKVISFLENYHAIKRFGKFNEITPFVLLLSSKHASYAAGTEINLDGGLI